MSALFSSVGQCLHIAYLMDVLPVAPPSNMQRVLKAKMQACLIWDAPKPTPTYFEGLTALEQRAQCALIRAKVDRYLSPLESAAIKVTHAHLLTKAMAVEVVASSIQNGLTTQNPEAILALAWYALGTQFEKKGITLRGIAKYYGLSKTTAHRDQQTLIGFHTTHYQMAINQISCCFEEVGWIDP